MFYTAANTKSSWDALDYVYKLSNYSHTLTQEIAFITKLKKKTKPQNKTTKKKQNKKPQQNAFKPLHSHWQYVVLI